MHPCLLICEVQRTILQHVDSNSTLIAFALACRAFFDPAMAAVWRRLTSLTPLLNLLPRAVFGPCRTRTVVSFQTLQIKTVCITHTERSSAC